jgi:glucan biosynthesis protein C
MEMEKKASTRVYYLDWLRVLAILTVFVYHTSRFFNVEDWNVKNPIWYTWVEVWNRFATTWMLPLIFVVSGASLFYAVGKGGAVKFVKDKALRLLVPVLVCDLTHASLQVYLYRLTHGEFSGSYFQYLPHYFASDFEWQGMHLWYLWVLFVFSVVLYPLFRWLKGRGQGVLSKLDSLMARQGGAYVLALPTVVVMLFANPGSAVFSVQNAGWPLMFYLWCVVAGFLLASQERVQAGIQQVRWLSLPVGLVLAFAWIPAYGLGQPPAYGTLRLALALGARGLASWCVIFAILGFGRRHLNFSTAFLSYANEAVLPFYILHQTVLLGVGYFVVQWAIPDLLKWVIVLVNSFILIMVLYEFLVRRFDILRILFGMKPLARQPVARPGTATPAARQL